MSRAVTALVIVNVLLTLYLVATPRTVVRGDSIRIRQVLPIDPAPVEFGALTVSLNGREPTVRAIVEEAARVSGRLLRINTDQLSMVGINPDREKLTPWMDGASVDDVLRRLVDELSCDQLEKVAWSAREPGFLDLSSRRELDRRETYSAFYDVRDLLYRLYRFDLKPSASRGGCGGCWASFTVTSVPSVRPSRLTLAFRALLGKDDPSFDDTVQELIDVVTETVAPEDWDVYGGDAASVRYIGGQVLITAPPRIHTEVQGLLHELDAAME